MTTFWKVPQGLIVIHDLLDMFQLVLLMVLQLLINVELVFLFFHLPLLILLLLQLGHISLMLLFFQLSLPILLLSQFSQTGMVMQDFYPPLILLLPL
jgi:hypothetical protein